MSESPSQNASSISRRFGTASSGSSSSVSTAPMSENAHNGALEALANNPEAQKFCQALYVAHQQLQEVQEANAELTRQLADLRLRAQFPASDASVSTGSRRQRGSNFDMCFGTEYLGKIGRFLQFFYTPRIPPAVFNQLDEIPTIAHNNPKRYSGNPDLQLQGFIADLRHCFPQKHLDKIDYPIVGEEIPGAMAQGLASTLNRVRGVASTIFDLSGKEFEVGGKSPFHVSVKRSEIHHIRYLVGMTMKAQRIKGEYVTKTVY
ncbi:hypothetical protein BDN70DRAFT_902426, partial [Pholiota conissans]